MTQYQVTYERVGRHGGRDGSAAPAPITVEAADVDDLAAEVYRDARQYLASRGVEVVVDLGDMRGRIFAGFQDGGSFTIKLLAPVEGGDVA